MQILFLGPPGSGKGTQGKKLAEWSKLFHLSSGDILRQAIKEQTIVGKQAQQFMDKGRLVPDAILIAMFEEVLNYPQYQKGFILDGFPRTLPQAESLDKLLEKLKLTLNLVLNLQVSDEVLLERMTGRRICSSKSCGAVYHVKFAPPKKEGICDLCGSPLTLRSDDEPKACKTRLEVYTRQTAPLISYYEKQNILTTIEAEGDPELIFQAIVQACEKVKKALV